MQSFLEILKERWKCLVTQSNKLQVGQEMFQYSKTVVCELFNDIHKNMQQVAIALKAIEKFCWNNHIITTCCCIKYYQSKITMNEKLTMIGLNITQTFLLQNLPPLRERKFYNKDVSL